MGELGLKNGLKILNGKRQHINLQAIMSYCDDKFRKEPTEQIAQGECPGRMNYLFGIIELSDKNLFWIDFFFKNLDHNLIRFMLI